MRTVVVRFADADAAAYYVATADFIASAEGRGVRRSFLRQRNEQELTQNVDAAAGTCANQTNSPINNICNTRSAHLFQTCLQWKQLARPVPTLSSYKNGDVNLEYKRTNG
ncbi:hypothetical protein IGI04_004398 [Brassica rapa subsp. trilocularis]|uniref:Uncharacterized protein n=1 Tax=Brassica rapa subsp. trilocularis TaxID=1813537 RepID=A0ABQ7NAZ8_BRACM|nr:hypothetical protein IGI04_004398 [Brassica rapa subsp. trilocularis]